MENPNRSLDEAVWPQEDAPVPEFTTAAEALAALAVACQVDPDSINTRLRRAVSTQPGDAPDYVEAWFTGAPMTTLLHFHPTSRNYRPTIGAGGIARKIQEGSWTPDRLTTPPDRDELPAPLNRDQLTFSGSLYGPQGANLLKPEDADEIDPYEEVAGVLAIDNQRRVVLSLADGTVLPFTARALADLGLTDVDLLSLDGESVVVRVDDVEVTAVDGDGNEINSLERMVIEVFFEDN